VRHRYPFEALSWLRHQRVDEQAAQVSESAARTAQALADEGRAEAARRGAERRVSEVSQAEHARLADGNVRAGELAQAADWHKGAMADVLAKLDRELRAREAVGLEAAAEAASRRALGVASQDAKLIDTHQGEWRALAQAAEERSEEEAATEQWTARRYPPRG
jgi:hypothetical protein